VDDHEELLFTDLALFNRKLADWLVFYNTERPHHSLGQRSPLSFLLQHQPECQRYWTHTPPSKRGGPEDRAVAAGRLRRCKAGETRGRTATQLRSKEVSVWQTAASTKSS
jgi:hypothetical protein